MREYEHVRALIQHLQAMRGRRLWAYEDASLLHPRLTSAEALRQTVGAMLSSIFFERELRERWAVTALDWMRSAHSRHLACRSHQACAHSLPVCIRVQAPVHSCKTGGLARKGYVHTLH